MWKTAFGRCIYRGSQVQVYDNGIFRWLTLGSSALQTVLYKRNPLRAGLYYIEPLILAAKLMPAECCLLGLGGGSVIHSLAPFLGEHQLTCVEYEQEIIEVAHRFFQISKYQFFNIVHQDASIYLKNCPQQFGHILVDLFDANYFPANCYQEEFFIDCKKALTDDGFLAVNLANKHEQKPIFDWIYRQFDAATLTIPVKGCANMIIFAANRLRIAEFIDKIGETKQLKQLSWDAQWGKVAFLK